MRSICRVIAAGLLLAASWSAQALSLVPGDVYTANGYRTLTHYDRSGNLLESQTLSFELGWWMEGMAFGPQGWLYVSLSTSNGAGLYAFDGSGALRESHAGSFYGELALGNNGQLYMAGSKVWAFTPGVQTPTVVYDSHANDVAPLPSGNLLVLSEYHLEERTAQGQLVRSIVPDNAWLVNARAVEYDPVSHDIFVSMLGYTDFSFKVMRLDGQTGHVKASATLAYATDLLLTNDGRLLVGSDSHASTLYDLDLNPLGTLPGPAQLYVTQMPVPEPAACALLLLGLPLLAWRSRRASGSS